MSLMEKAIDKIHDRLIDGICEGEVEVCGEEGVLTVEYCGEITEWTEPRPGVGNPERMKDFEFQIINKKLTTE